MGRKFRLGRRRKCTECSKGGALSLVVSLPRQALVNSCVFRASVVSRLPVPALPCRTSDCNSSELLNAIVSFPLSDFTCSTLLTSELLGACLLKIALPSPWVITHLHYAV